MKCLTVSWPTISAEDNWKRIAEKLQATLGLSPMELYQFQCIYFQGVHDFLLVNRELSEKMPPVMAATLMRAYAEEIFSFFKEENITKLAEEAQAADDAYFQGLADKFEKTCADAEVSPADVPHLPTKPTLH